MVADFEHDFLIDVWVQPESGVIILGEDMPRELMPWCERADMTTIESVRETVARQYADTHTRLASDPTYQDLKRQADSEAVTTPTLYLARNRLAIHVELHTPMH